MTQKRKSLMSGMAGIVFAGRRYGVLVLEQEQGRAKLISADKLESRQKDKAMVIEKHKNFRGQEKLAEMWHVK